ncbi:MAG: hypothetical protein H6R00_5035 [Proteobacteria bacterium]|nr:hypothetical protein [Pseudomonadota bacterium]
MAAQHPINKPAEKILLLGRETGKKIAAHCEATVLQSIRPAAAGGCNLHQHLAPDPAAAMQQTIGFQPINETHSCRMRKADDRGDLTYARRRVVRRVDQSGDGRWGEIIISGKRSVGNGQ